MAWAREDKMQAEQRSAERPLTPDEAARLHAWNALWKQLLAPRDDQGATVPDDGASAAATDAVGAK